MIILDTNIVAALTHRGSNAMVAAWLDTLDPEAIYTTSITALEIEYGLALLADDDRRRALRERWETFLAVILASRVLVFDFDAAKATGALMARRRQSGRTVEWRDTQIAGIALARDATLATRNTRHFSDAGIGLIDPFEAA